MPRQKNARPSHGQCEAGGQNNGHQRQAGLWYLHAEGYRTPTRAVHSLPPSAAALLDCEARP